MFIHTTKSAHNTLFHPFFTFLSIHPLSPLPSSSIPFRFLLLFTNPLQRAEIRSYLHNERSLGAFFACYEVSMRLGCYHYFCQALTTGFTMLFTPKITIITICILVCPPCLGAGTTYPVLPSI